MKGITVSYTLLQGQCDDFFSAGLSNINNSVEWGEELYILQWLNF